MKHITPFIALFVLFSVLAADNAAAAPFALDSETTPHQSMPNLSVFSADTFFADSDIYLGQRTRRRGGDGQVWANLYYGDATLKPDEEFRDFRIHPSFYGLQLGFDILNSHVARSMFFVNINKSKTKFDGEATSKIDNYMVGGGKFYYWYKCHFAFTGSVSYDRYNLSVFDINGKGDGLQTNFFGEFGLDFQLGRWGIKPFYALQYDFLYHGNIREPSFVLVNDWNGHGLNQLTGLRLNLKATESLEFQSRAVWVHEMLDNPPPFYHARFSTTEGVQTPAIMHFAGNTGRDWVWLGFGAKFEPTYKVITFFNYDVLLNNRHVTHLGNFGFSLSW